MADSRVEKMARILVDYSTNVQPGEKVMVEASMAAEPLVRCLYQRILERGAHPHLLISLPDQDEVMYRYAGPDQLDFTNEFDRLAAETFDARIRVYSQVYTRALSHLDPAKAARRQKATAVVQNAIFRRAAEDQLRWVSTQFATSGYAVEAEMGWNEYLDFMFRACHADDETADPVAYWQSIRKQQETFIAKLQGHDKVTVKGPDVDLSLSIKDRVFLNSCGIHNLPDGEIYTGPVEDSINGWVCFTYPAVYGGRVVEGVELKFENGKAVSAHAKKDEEYLVKMLDSDAGARFVGEFAIGTNHQIDRFTRNILFDEKIGGTFHMAMGASYPETGGRNKSVIHWDMICDLHHDAEIRADGELVYRDGAFVA